MDAYKKRFKTDVLVIVTLVQHPLSFPKRAKERNSPSLVKKREDLAKDRTKRLTDMVRWAEKELDEYKAHAAAGQFLFTDLDTTYMTHRELFLKPHFKVPFSDMLEAMIPQESGNGFN